MKKLIMLITFLIIPLGVYANESFSSFLSSNSEIELNQEFTVSINLSNLSSSGLSSGQYYLKYDNSKVSYIGYSTVQGNAADFTVNNTGNMIIILYVDNTGGLNPLKNGIFANFKFKTISEGNSTISLSGEGFSTIRDSIINLTTNTSSKQFNIYKKEIVNPSNNETTTSTTTTTKAITTNKPTTTITTTTTKKISNESNNNESNDEKTDNNLFLKNLTIDGFNIEFDSNKTEYSLTVPYETTKLNVNYETYSDNTIVKINNNDLIIGENNITLKVINENQEERIYTIKAIRNNKYNLVNFDKVNIINLINNGEKFLEVNIDYMYNYKIIEKSILQLIKDNDVEIKINVIKNNNDIYYLILNKDTLLNINNDLNININDKIESKLNLKNYISLNLLNNNNWYSSIPVYYNVEKYNDKIYLYEVNKNISLKQELKKDDKYVKLNLDSSKQYIISNTKNIKNTTNKIIYICIIFFITIIIISIIFVSILINKNRKNLKK